MATELEHPESYKYPEERRDEYLMGLDAAHQKELAENDRELAAVMKRMDSNKRAMEKAQGTEDYWRFALTYDLASLEYKNVWLARSNMTLRHEARHAKHFLDDQQNISRQLLEQIETLLHRVAITEQAMKGLALRQITPVEVNPIIQAFQQGILRERSRKPKEQTTPPQQSTQTTPKGD